MRAVLRAALRGLTWQFLSVRLAFWSTKIPKSPPVIFKPSNTATCAGMESIGNRKTLVSVQHAAAAAEPRTATNPCGLLLQTYDARTDVDGRPGGGGLQKAVTVGSEI